MFDNLFDDIRIQSQYQNTNIETLLNGIKEIRTRFIIKALNSVINDVFDITKANGDVLNMWGNIIGLSRFVPSKKESGSFRNLNFYQRNFNIAKFFNNKDIQYLELGDYAYRQLLMLMYQSRNQPCTIRYNTQISRDVLKSDIVTGDSMDMTYITYYFREDIPVWLDWSLTNYDILPRPAGVQSRFISAIFKIFGFYTDDVDYNRKKLANFWNAQFARVEHIKYYEEIQKFKDYQSDIITIAEAMLKHLDYELEYSQPKEESPTEDIETTPPENSEETTEEEETENAN